MILFSKLCKPLWTVHNHFTNIKKRFTSTQMNAELFLKKRRELKNKKEVDATGWGLLVIPVTAFGLGTWQVQRKIWKEGLIQELKERTSLEPVEFPKDLKKLEEMEYHPVRVKGKFDHSREIYLGPRSCIKNKNYSTTQSLFSTGSTGFLVITPFTLSDRNLTILVNRGWVPAKEKNPKNREKGQVTGEVEIVGLVRHSESRPPLGMKNIPEKGFWQYRDFNTMSEVVGAAPIMIDAVESASVPGGPIGGQTVIGLRNEHLSYLLTWYGVSACTGVMWYLKYIRRVPT